MDRRFISFIILAWLTVVGYGWLVQRNNPPKPAPVAAGNANPAKADAKDVKKPVDKSDNAVASPAVEKVTAEKQPESKSQPKSAADAKIAAAHEPEVPQRWLTIGSADASSPYRMLVTLTNKGAAVARIELNSSHYCDVDDRSGYLGHLTVGNAEGKGGCLVQIVGPGTPAAIAGMKPGDVIKTINNKPVRDAASLNALLEKTRPNQKIHILVLRDGQEVKLEATLRRRPLDVVQPENNDPLSMLLTLNQLDHAKLSIQTMRDMAIYRLYSEMRLSDKEIASLDDTDIELSAESGRVHLPAESQADRKWVELPPNLRGLLSEWKTLRNSKPGSLFVSLNADGSEGPLTDKQVREVIARIRAEENQHLPLGLSAELQGVDLRDGNWKVVSEQTDRVVFERTVPESGVTLTKTYRLAKVPAEQQQDGNYPAYHLVFDIEVKNTSSATRSVAYRLDGPNGLPKEGWWYASRVTRSGGSGLRDFIISLNGQTPAMIGAVSLASDQPQKPVPDQGMTFIGVDAQYFSAVLMPQRKDPNDVWFDQLWPIRVGKIDPQHHNLTNTSCRLISKTIALKPGDEFTHSFHLFAGPKKQALLDKPEYKLGELIYFGWPIFAVVAVPLTVLLHWLYAVACNYGLAIILLTVVVRGLMFPLSIKQALGAQKMQLLQPEIKKIQERHKSDRQAMAKAQQELFQKHNYNPLAGCLPIFIQLPVFMGLYRSLMVAIELRDAPLISHAIRWCSNLAAPDMLFNWSPFMPAFVTSGVGIFGLGPYFNLLPLLTIVLFLWQQKAMTPPPADEQAAMQQKIMRGMMLFMGLLFFKVASGLCIYFIASSIWGLVERLFLPKPAPVASGPETRADVKARARQTKPKK